MTEMIAPYRIPVFNELAQGEEIELHVMFLSETDTTIRQWFVYRDEIRFSYEVLPSWRRNIWGYPILLNSKLRSAINRWRPHVLICGGYSYLASWEALLWAKLHRVLFVLWCESNLNDIRSDSPAVDLLKRIFIKHCGSFVVPGKASIEYLKRFGIPDKMITKAPNAVDNDLFSRKADVVRCNEAIIRHELNLPSRFFLYVGRLVREKGIFDLLEAYKKLDDRLRSEVSLLFVGDGPAKRRLLESAAHGTSQTVRCTGFVQRDDLPKYYALAEALIFPTRSDPWGLVVNEAMACGLPVIASSVAGCTPDLIKNSWNGYVVPPGDIERMVWAMSTLARQPELAKRMGAFSAEHIRNFSPRMCAAGLSMAAVRAAETIIR